MWYLGLEVVSARPIGMVEDNIPVLDGPSIAFSMDRIVLKTLHLPLIHQRCIDVLEMWRVRIAIS